MREFKVGDKVVDQSGNLGEVFEINTTLTYPIKVRFRIGTNSFTKEGREYTDNSNRFIKHAAPEPIEFEVCDVVEHPLSGRGVITTVHDSSCSVVFRDGIIRRVHVDNLTLLQKFGHYDEPVKPKEKEKVLVAPYIFKTSNGEYIKTNRMVTEEVAVKSHKHVHWCVNEAIKVEVD